MGSPSSCCRVSGIATDWPLRAHFFQTLPRVVGGIGPTSSVSFCRGMSYVAIAEAREVKVVTIRNAIYTIQVKLGVGSKQEVVVWAAQNGLLDD